MERVTFRDPGVARRVNRDTIPVRLEAGAHPALFRKYGGRRVPLVVWTGPDGTAITSRVGYQAPADFLEAFPRKE